MTATCFRSAGNWCSGTACALRLRLVEEDCEVYSGARRVADLQQYWTNFQQIIKGKRGRGREQSVVTLTLQQEAANQCTIQISALGIWKITYSNSQVQTVEIYFIISSAVALHGQQKKLVQKSWLSGLNLCLNLDSPITSRPEDMRLSRKYPTWTLVKLFLL